MPSQSSGLRALISGPRIVSPTSFDMMLVFFILLTLDANSFIGPGTIVAAQGRRLRLWDWCPWNRWSYCAPTPCSNVTLSRGRIKQYPGSQGNPTQGDNPLASNVNQQDSGIDYGSYCVDPLSTETSSSNLGLVVVRYWKDGVEHTTYPTKQRSRVCNCRQFSLLNVFTNIVKDRCPAQTQQFQCARCRLNEQVHISRGGNAPLLPLCPTNGRSVIPLYKIFGGIAGAVVGLLFIIWLVRTLMLTCPTCRARTGAGVGGDGAGVNGLEAGSGAGGRRSSQTPTGADWDPRRGRRRSRQLERSGSNLSGELPPDYKDITAALPSIAVLGGAQQQQHSPLLLSINRDPITHRNRQPSLHSSPSSDSSAQTPPPAYESIVSCLQGQPVGIPLVHMHSTVSSGGGGGGGGNGGEGAVVPAGEEHPTGDASSGDGGGGGGGGGGGTTVDTDVVVLSPRPC